jgi:hypothetical protein
MTPVKKAIREGGWVIIFSSIIFVALTTWALAPAVLKMTTRPPGDGTTLASYEFDLSNLRLPERASLETAMLHRDMVPVLDAPPSLMTAAEVLAIVDTRDRYLVSDDAVIGVEINGQSRAYPLSTLHVHEIIHDELGGIPIAVTWHWPSSSPRVFDRRIGEKTEMFGISGLVAGGNQTLYVRRDDGEIGGEALISQLLGRTITGEPLTLSTLPYRFTDWTTWQAAHADTTVAGRIPSMKKRYKHGDPSSYYRSTPLLFDTPVPDDGPAAKEPMVLLTTSTNQVMLLNSHLTEQEQVDIGPLGLSAAAMPPRLEIAAPPPGHDVRHSLFHALHALELDTENQ